MTAHHVIKAAYDEYMCEWVWEVADCPGRPHCVTYEEAEWPDGVSCRCDAPECPCRETWHDECVTYPMSAVDLGPVCRLAEVEGCAVTTWLEELGSEIIHGTAAVLLTAYVAWDQDGPTVTLTGGTP